MDRKSWRETWLRHWQGLHQPDYNRWLVSYWPKLGLRPGARAFLPFCGKSLDLRWLAEQGYEVLGIELSHIAIEAYFEEAAAAYAVEAGPNLPCYRGSCRGASTRIYCGDFFELTAEELRGVDGVFDRAALSVLPRHERHRYADHLLRILPVGTSILLVTFEYDQNLVAGPPFAVHAEEVQALYGERCEVQRLDRGITEALPAHFGAQGVERAGEGVYWLVKRG